MQRHIKLQLFSTSAPGETLKNFSKDLTKIKVCTGLSYNPRITLQFLHSSYFLSTTIS